MGRFCEVHSCLSSNTRNFNKSFYKFPSDVETCASWVKFCRSPDLTKLFRESGVAAFRRKIVCSDHFSAASLRDSLRSDKGLRVGAIPTITTDYTSESNCRCIQDDDRRLNQGTAEHYCNVQYLDGEALADDTDLESIRSEQVNLSDAEYLVEDLDGVSDTVKLSYQKLLGLTNAEDRVSSIDSVELMPLENLCLTNAEHTNQDHDDESEVWLVATDIQYGNETLLSNEVKFLKRMLQHEREKNSEHKAKLQQLQEQLRVCRRKCERRYLTIQSLRRKSKTLIEQLKLVRKNTRHNQTVLDGLKGNPALYNSLKNSTKKPKGRRYNPELRKFALSSYLCGPRVYRLMKKSKVICLPGKRTIKRWTKDVRIGPGLNKAILEQVKSKVSNFSERERVVMLAIDGMKVKSGLSYNAKCDTFYGFPDDGLNRKIEKNSTRYLATEAVTVMVKGVYGKFKQALGYYLTHNSLRSEQQMQIIEKTIRAVREVGLEPLILVMDQFATNQKMAKEAGVTKDKPYFTVDGKKVYVMWDSPHLIKSGRNMLKKHNAVFDGEIASFVDIENLYEVDSLANPRIAPRLTEKHIKLPPFSPMNVSLATRTLSQSVATALNYYADTGELDERVRESVNFIITHDHLFDTFNSRQEHCSKKPFKSALQEKSCHWEFLEKTKALLEELYFTSKQCVDVCEAPKESRNLTAKQRRPNYVGGFIHNINALKMLWDELVKTFGCEYLCTNNLCQDCLENLFSEIRRRCGSNDTPDCLQFGAAFKYACIETVGCSNEGTNCEKDGSTPLLSTTDPDMLSKNSNEQNHKYKFTPLDLSTAMEIPIKELNALMYLAGAAARKLIHLKCMKNLKAEPNDNISDEDAYRFCKIKQSVYGRSFVLPNNNLYRISVLCLAAFKQKFNGYLYQNHRFVKTRLKEHISQRLFENVICERCFDLLIDKIFNTLIQGFLKQQKALSANSKKTIFKRKGKARRMCLPLKTKSS